MALLRSAPDTWTAEGVQSSFSVDFAPPELTGATDTCGWGWRFGWRLYSDRLMVYFDPHLIANAHYGRVSWQTLAIGLRAVPDQGFVSLDLPVGAVAAAPYYQPLGMLMGSWRTVVSSEPGKPRAAPVFKITISFAGLATLPVLQPAVIQTRLPFSAEPLPARIRACLVDTIHGGELIDIKFWVYSRVGNGCVSHPRPLYGSLKLMCGTSKQFDEDIHDMLSGFSESGQTDIANDEAPEEKFAEYEYMSDSDLDDDEETEAIVNEELVETANVKESDTVLQSSTQASVTTYLPVKHHDSGRHGHRIVIKGHAYNTWKALLYYLYTGQIHFRALKTAKHSGPVGPREDGAPECSPKSMYKLADKHDFPELKSLARDAILSQLSANNIVTEVFSDFTAMFDEIKATQVAFLRKRLHSPAVREAMTGMLPRLCAGRGSSASAAVLQDVIFGP
ncbi:hypothetical protein MIND_00802100 [Mycena indigotica]|uniref:BTB domain-containing protein n=1 Tax=Mycena indigotica TaxID=2126181 RepID=A0A8H6W431_9AGAR|nr:uncharacterized protein MIND_00802100 [Mycena indigotica]KAF7298554.1 hypothetical protein MIND_00802100 [Mycena indigotica]